MSDLNRSGGSPSSPVVGKPWPPPRNLPAVPEEEAQPWDTVKQLKQMADLLGDALAVGERKVAETRDEAAAAWDELQRARNHAEQAQKDASAQLAAALADREQAQRDAAAAWGEVQRARA
ncbi:hypothetical protein, partial [Actinomadura sp. HBU206391]|uniref:hypothetical protein n=1 Tax=Actinomadura sp. HBU206391 TaxID=2731692 RepID=UPI001C9BC903